MTGNLESSRAAVAGGHVTDEVVIVGAARTAVGRFGGSLRDTPAVELGAIAVRAAVERGGLQPGDVQRVVAGQNIQVTPRGNPARQVLLKAGVPNRSTDYTVNMNCASGLRAMTSLAENLLLRDVDLGAAVGMENMSRTPYLLEDLRWGQRLGSGQVIDFLGDYILGDAGPMAENVASTYHISRRRQDDFALESQRRAGHAISAGLFRDDIVGVPMHGTTDPAPFEVDEHPRADLSAARLAALPPAFGKDGTVTAGNSSGINDGAAAVVLTRASAAADRGLHPRAALRSWAAAGVEPGLFGMGPVPAVREVLKRSGLALQDIALIELNEAFASSTLAVIDELGLDPARVNVNGGAIALGHPVGATGLVLLIKLIAELERRRDRYGLVTMCIGNGQGMAVIIENAGI